MLDKVFEQLNLTKNDLAVYLALLESGATSVGHLARKVGLPRSSLYGFLGHLTKKGFVRQSEGAGLKIWQAQPPEKIQELIKDKISTWENINGGFNSILPSLQEKYKTELIKPKITYFEGIDEVKYIVKDLLLYDNITALSFWPIKDMIEILGVDFFIYYNKRRIKQNIQIKAIWPQDKQVDINQNIFLGVGKEFKREIRLAPKGIDCSMGYMIYKNKMAYISSKKEGFGFIVESRELSQLNETQFNVLWDISKPLKVDLKYTEEFLEQ